MSIVNQLFEAIYYGTDLEFKYGAYYYFINSGRTKEGNIDKHSITVFKSKGSIYEGENDAECIEIYSAIEDNANDNTNNLFETKIFDGKTFYEIADLIIEINY